ncbi:hypothetical protein AcW1_002972 [Taiwanofungus camphoratus]|nr:hypothetical protein AcW1_002972 [Antrodia cinnamomea]
MDPAVLARNVLLFTLIADKYPYTTAVWNIFFHMYLDKNAYAVLIEQCRKLIDVSSSLQRWNTSPYGPFIKMCTEYTLSELRRHWMLYVGAQNLPRERMKAIRDAFAQAAKPSLEGVSINLSSARSAGPAMLMALAVSSEQFNNYWKNGVTSNDPVQIAAATLLNPTFIYSLGGEGCSVHYGTDPLISFHLAPVFGNAKGSVSVTKLVNAAKAEFSDWCSAFQAALTSKPSTVPVIRFFLGEATAVCRALHAFATTGTLESRVPVADWNAHLIQLSSEDYVVGGAPTRFNVIDTSNLDDHIGLLNILIAAVPLLSSSPPFGVLYTESLLARSNDATKEFTKRLYADIAVIGLILGLCPVDYLSGFTTRSNWHELMIYSTVKEKATQFHQVTTWKSPAAGDSVSIQNAALQLPVFDTRQLGTFLYDMYCRLFEQEDAAHFLRLNQDNIVKAWAESNLVHYTRESFVLFLRLVRDKLRISQEQWREVMGKFFDLQTADRSFPMDSNSRQDFATQLHRYGVYTTPFIESGLPKIGPFKHWNTVPSLVRIILTIPRENFAVLDESVEQICTPLLQCEIRGDWSHNHFSSVHAVFGTATIMGTKARPWAVLNDDAEGRNGTSSIVVSFTVLTKYLTAFGPMENLSVCISVCGTPGSAVPTSKLGIWLTLFSARLMDVSHVNILPEQPLLTRKAYDSSPLALPMTNTGLSAQIGQLGGVTVELDEQCELVTSFTARVSVESEDVKRAFQSGATPQIVQISPCVMRLTIVGHPQDVPFPFPVIGSKNKLRLARKSLYVEVVIPISDPFKEDGMKLNPFPVVSTDKNLNLWNIHRINLSRLPVLDVNATKLDRWLNPHVGSMMSSRERSLRKKHREDALMFIKDSLHMIFVRSSGIQAGPPRRLFALLDKATNNCDTIFFVSELRFDVHSHTMICDGYVLPLTDDLMPRIRDPFGKLLRQGDVVHVSAFKGEMQAWKQLLPALVERCRSWKHGDNCEYKAQGRIPLSEETDTDPLCSCGRGKDTEGMCKVGLWSKLAPYVTRVALSPLFAVSYMETIGRDPTAHKCSVCRGRGKPKIMVCKGCNKTRYCSGACQKKDWKTHKPRCKP